MAGRTDLDNHAKVGCMIDDVVRDEREAREAVTLSGGGHQPPPVVDQLQLREITSDFAEEVSEGGSDNSSVQKLAESLSAIVETLSFASKGKSKDKKGHWPRNLPREDSGRAHHRDRMLRRTASRGRSLRKQEESWKGLRRRAKAKARVEEVERQGQAQWWRKGQRQGKRPQIQRVRGDSTPREVVPQRRMG